MGLKKALDKATDKISGTTSVQVSMDDLVAKVNEWFITASNDPKYLEKVKKTAKGAGVFSEYGTKSIHSPCGRYELFVDVWNITVLPGPLEPLWHAIFPSRSVVIFDNEEKINYRLDKDKDCKKFYKAVAALVKATQA